MRFDAGTHTVHAAGRTWQADPTRTVIDDQTYPSVAHRPGSIYTTRTRRCLVRFESGWAASIVWGTGTYSSNHDTFGFSDDERPFTEEPDLVEVGVIDHGGELRQRQHIDDDGLEWNDVEAYVDDVALASLLDQLATLPTDYDYGKRPPTMDELRTIYEQVRDLDPDLPQWPE